MGLNYTGIFAIATYMAVMVSIPYRSLTAIASPQLSMAIKNNDRQETGHLLAQVTGNLLLIGGLILAAIWVNIDLIFTILPNGETYAIARRTVLLLGVGQLFVATFQFELTALSYSRYYPFSLLLSFVLTALSLVLNNLFIPRWGMDGAALATLISQVSYYVLAIITVRFALGSRLLTRRHLLIIVLLVALFVANSLCLHFMPGLNIWLSSLLRSLLIGIVAMLRTREQISNVYEAEREKVAERDDVKRAWRDLLEKMDMQPEFPSDVRERPNKLVQELRYLSPTNNPEAIETDQNLVEGAQSIGRMIFDYRLNSDQIAQRLSQCERLLQRRRTQYSK